MSDYRRAWLPTGTFFFTVDLMQRQGNYPMARQIDIYTKRPEVG